MTFLLKKKVGIQLGFKGISIAQGNEVKIVTTYPMPMQIDGEPFILIDSKIWIFHKNQALMVKHR